VCYLRSHFREPTPMRKINLMKVVASTSFTEPQTFFGWSFSATAAVRHRQVS